MILSTQDTRDVLWCKPSALAPDVSVRKKLTNSTFLQFKRIQSLPRHPSSFTEACGQSTLRQSLDGILSRYVIILRRKLVTGNGGEIYVLESLRRWRDLLARIDQYSFELRDTFGGRDHLSG